MSVIKLHKKRNESWRETKPEVRERELMTKHREFYESWLGFFGVLGNPWESESNSPWRRRGELAKIPPYPKEWTDITCAEEDTNLPLHPSLEHIRWKRSEAPHMTNLLLLFDFWLDIPLFWLKYAELTEPRQLNEHLQGIYLCLYYIFSLWTFFRHFMVFTDNCCWHNVRV